MARTFTAASSEYLNIASTPVTAAPLTLACWFNVDLAAFYIFLGIVDVGSTNNYIDISIRGPGGGSLLRCTTSSGIAGGQADTSAAPSADTWHHACGVFSAANARAVYLDGGNKGTNATSVTPTGIESVNVGRRGDSTPVGYTNGSIAEAAIWNAALTDAEVAVLAAGYAPPFVRLSSLVFYMPLVRDNDEDIVGGLSLTAFNTPTIGSHPRIIYPSTPHTFGQTPTTVFSLHGKTFLYTAANWPTTSWYFEVDMRATAGTADVRLWDITAGAAVANSDLTTTSATFVQLRSSALTLVDGNEYRAQYGTFPGHDGETRGATLIGI